MAGRGDEHLKLHLSKVEQNLRRLLLDVAQYINPEKPSELRFTGGWVRDKLLGVDSHDIDVAINDMTGYQFGLRMKEFLEDPARAEQYGIGGLSQDGTSSSNKVGGLHKIEANPEKSKHLETVTTKIFGLDVDLVNLRKETYTQDSRNPQMEFGTAQEDALRRDATINAMFYNLQDEMVEDLTGKGLGDMRDHIIRTPLEPLQTFTDDPLRVLRLIRFTSKYEYMIDEATRESMRDPRVKEALKLKITRERVGVEVEKMLRGPHPLQALTLIDELGLYDTIFTDPTQKSHYQPDVKLWHVTYQFANDLLNDPHSQLRNRLLINEHDVYFAWLLATLVPYADAPLPEPDAKGKKKSPIATEVIKEGVKAANKAPIRAWDTVTAAVTNFESIRDTKDSIVRHKRLARNTMPAEDDPTTRDKVGMLIRKWGASWRMQVLFALMTEVTQSHDSGKDPKKDYQTFLSHVHELNLSEVCSEKPLLDGNQLRKALGVAPGPWLAPALDVVMAWQLQHPNSAATSSALEAVRSSGVVPTPPSNGFTADTKAAKATGELLTRLTVHFLTLTIRPLFAKTKTQHDERITAQGRQRQDGLLTGERRRNLDVEDETVTKPWKLERNAYALDLLDWCARSLSFARTERCWPLLIPPILAVLDDTDVPFKARGCGLLRHLLKATTPQLLQRTGLAPVFHDAVTPCLYYLPSLTPEQDCIRLLDAAYPTLLQLHAVRYPPTSSGLPPTATSASMSNLHALLHTHVLSSISHVISENPSIIPAILIHTNTIIHRLGENTIVHLQYLIPVLNEVLDRPFVASLPGIEDISVMAELLSLVVSASKCLQHVISQAWRRVWRWNGEISKGVVGCWTQLVAFSSDNDAAAHERVREAKTELARVVAMLVRVEDAVANASENGVLFTLEAESANEKIEKGAILKTLVELEKWDGRLAMLRQMVLDLHEGRDASLEAYDQKSLDCETCREERHQR